MLLCIEVFLVRRIEHIRETVRQVNALQPGNEDRGDLDDFSYLATVMASAIDKVKQSDELADVTWNEIAKFRVALDQSFDHMIITDVEGKILYANSAAEKLTGFSRLEMQGKTPALWGGQMSREFYDEFWDTIRRQKKPFEGVVKNKRKDGTPYQAQVRVTPVLDDKKRILYFIGVERLAEKC
jgi:PAS domain S-box-containing protein